MHFRTQTLLAVFFLVIPLAATAESVQWNTAVNATLSYDGGAQCNAALDNPNVTISYNVRATDAATGVNVCGTSVPAGTQIKFEFVPHTWQDIYWFGTGYDFDSPYGDWSAGAEAPTSAEEWCSANTYINTFGTYSDILRVRMRNESHVPLRVEPPSQAVTNTGTLSCGTPAGDGSVTCTANAPGSITPTFDFAGTFGHFYFAILWDSNWLRHPKWSGGPLCQPTGGSFTGGNNEPLRIVTGSGSTCKDASQIYTLNVPQQSISCPITVVAPQGNPPAAPKLASAGACSIGAPYAISMQSIDPDGDGLRYAIDWNADGSIDQFVPGSGYVQSGTMQTASRTYSLAGAKTVKVLAQDTNGLSSSWATLSFTCADSSTTGLNENDSQNTNTNQNNTSAPTVAVLDLRVIPSLVRSGNTTKVNWSATGVSSCSVTAPNGDTWSTLQSAIGGNISKPITGQTTYTLSCIDLNGTPQTRQATVRVLPTWRER